MEVSYHPLVKRDVAEALRYYHDVSPFLAAEFEAELRALISRAAETPSVSILPTAISGGSIFNDSRITFSTTLALIQFA